MDRCTTATLTVPVVQRFLAMCQYCTDATLVSVKGMRLTESLTVPTRTVTPIDHTAPPHHPAACADVTGAKQRQPKRYQHRSLQ
ncbi:hypothetical protein Slala05_83820 [Streptomyces lavendulae subsp. lavendulae]|nr:hypothetical protein Slala05_83820 [Streptomyces lavendulae subsp. lavendulae]